MENTHRKDVFVVQTASYQLLLVSGAAAKVFRDKGGGMMEALQSDVTQILAQI